MLKILTLLFFCISLPTTSLAFEHWHVSTDKSIKSILIANRKAQAQVLWISGPIKGLPSDPDEKLEHSYQIQAYGHLEIPLIEFSQFPWVHLKTESPGNLLVSARTQFDQEVVIQPGNGNRRLARPRPNSELILMNLAPFEQTIKAFTSTEQLSFQVPAFESIRSKLPASNAGKTLSIEGTARIQGFLVSPQGSQSFQISSEPSLLQPASNKVYFRLSNESEGSSYIVGLTDEAMISQAKDQVSQKYGQPGPWLPRILVAQIDFGSNQENRDFTKKGSPVWSWHISHIFNFSQLAHQDCDGSPEMLEELLNVWRQGSRTICFWNYHVVEQISLENLQSGKRTTRSPASKPLVPASLRPSL